MNALGKRIRSPPRKGSIWLRKSHSAMRVWREDRRFKFDNGEIISRKKVWSKGQQKGVIVKVQTDEGYIEYVYYPRPEDIDRRFKFDNGEIISRKKVWSKGQQKGVIVKVQTDEGYIEYVYYPRPEH